MLCLVYCLKLVIFAVVPPQCSLLNSSPQYRCSSHSHPRANKTLLQLVYRNKNSVTWSFLYISGPEECVLLLWLLSTGSFLTGPMPWTPFVCLRCVIARLCAWSQSFVSQGYDIYRLKNHVPRSDWGRKKSYTALQNKAVHVLARMCVSAQGLLSSFSGCVHSEVLVTMPYSLWRLHLLLTDLSTIL